MIYTDVIVVGAGPTGLGASRQLQILQIPHIVVEGSGEAGAFWRNTWDDFELLTPFGEIQLPDLDLSSFSPSAFPTQTQLLQIFKDYALQFKLPIHYHTLVTSIEYSKKSKLYLVTAAKGALYLAKNIIICTGQHHQPKIPPLMRKLPKDRVMLSTHYRNPRQFSKNSRILVLGSGISALSIAEKLSQTHEVHLSCKYDDKEIEANNSHLFTSTSQILAKLQLPTMQKLKGIGITLLPPVISIEENELILQKPNGDETRITIDSYQYFILATGFTFTIDILRPPLDSYLLKHRNGITPLPGFYVAGIPDKHTKSAISITQGVQMAIEIVNHLSLVHTKAPDKQLSPQPLSASAPAIPFRARL